MMHTLTGSYGNADRLDLPTVPEAAQTVCVWLVTAPLYHPAWSQYRLCVVRLDEDVAGFAKPKHHFTGSTHELNVVALDPTTKYQAVGFFDKPTRILTPVNIAEQFITVDEHMIALAEYMVNGVINGLISPETAGQTDMVRQQWYGSTRKTLAHIRMVASAEQN